MSIEIDRLRYEIQRYEATIHSNTIEMESQRIHMKDIELNSSKMKIEYDRLQDELSRVKISLNQSISREEDLTKQLQVQARTLKH